MKKSLFNLSILALATSLTLSACPGSPTEPSPSATVAPTATPPAPGSNNGNNGGTQPSAAPTVQPTPNTTASVVSLTEAKFYGTGDDKVGTGSNLTANGNPDAQIRIKLISPSEIEIKSIEIIQTDANGTQLSSARQWITSPSSNWVIGVFNSVGEQLNKDRNTKNLFAMNGIGEYDLFVEAQSEGTNFFNVGNHYKVIITDETGAKSEQRFSI